MNLCQVDMGIFLKGVTKVSLKNNCERTKGLCLTLHEDHYSAKTRWRLERVAVKIFLMDQKRIIVKMKNTWNNDNQFLHFR